LKLKTTLLAVENVQKRPNANVYNGAGSPGTEVGAGATLPTGLGVVEKENIHEVHVISGKIVIKKAIAGSLSDPNDAFTFVIHKDGTEYARRTIAPTKNDTLVLEYLPRGTYTVTELQDGMENYHLVKVEIVDANCENSLVFNDEENTVTFVMGNNTESENVIGKAVDAKGKADRYTSYVDPVNGVYGEVIFTNSFAVSLPNTGGPGTYLYQFSGLLLCAAALVYGCTLRRKHRKEASE